MARRGALLHLQGSVPGEGAVGGWAGGVSGLQGATGALTHTITSHPNDPPRPPFQNTHLTASPSPAAQAVAQTVALAGSTKVGSVAYLSTSASRSSASTATSQLFWLLGAVKPLQGSPLAARRKRGGCGMGLGHRAAAGGRKAWVHGRRGLHEERWWAPRLAPRDDPDDLCTPLKPARTAPAQARTCLDVHL